MNTKLIKQIEQAILAEPRRLEMKTWINRCDRVAPCGTAACIAGYAVILSRMEKGKGWYEAAQQISTRHCGLEAAELLDIGLCQSLVLFYVARWPFRYRLRLSHAVDRKAKAKVAVDRLRYFRRTGK